MKPHLKYLKYVLLHKWYVFVAGRTLGGVPLWRLIIHDWSKFSKAEWRPYVRRFFSSNAGKEDKSIDPDEFKKAFEHHWKRNPHHWEWWLRPGGSFPFVDVPTYMYPSYVYEMIADWLAAGKGITGSWDLTEWYNSTKDRQKIHPDTRALIEGILEDRVYGPRGVIQYLESK